MSSDGIRIDQDIKIKLIKISFINIEHKCEMLELTYILVEVLSPLIFTEEI